MLSRPMSPPPNPPPPTPLLQSHLTYAHYPAFPGYARFIGFPLFRRHLSGCDTPPYLTEQCSQPGVREKEMREGGGEGLTAPPVHSFSIGQTYCCCFPLRRLSRPAARLFVASVAASFCCLALSLDFVCCLTTTAFYLFLGFHPTDIQFLFIPTSSHFHNSLLPPHQSLGEGYGRRGSVEKGELRTPAEEMDEIDGRRERGKKERERWGDLFFFFLQAIPLRRHN